MYVCLIQNKKQNSLLSTTENKARDNLSLNKDVTQNDKPRFPYINVCVYIYVCVCA